MIKLCAFADEAAIDLNGQIEALKRNGIDLIELRTVDGKSVIDFTLDEAKSYYEELQKNGIEVWSIGSPIGKVDIAVDIDEYLEKVRHICRLANIFHAKNIRIFSFFRAYGERDRVIQYLNEMTSVAEEYGVALYHENEKGIYGDSLERVLDVLENVKGLKSIYDPANYLQVGEKAEDTISALIGRTDYFHIKDVIVATDELVPAGYGDGDIERIIRSIRDDKVLTLEPHLMIFEGYNSIDEAEMKNKFHFSSNAEAFDAAVKALKKILTDCGYQEKERKFEKEN